MSANRSVGRNASTIGMMEGAFFVSRGDLLSWVNNLLQVNLTKVEQCASGSIYCQIIDACHPNTVAMRKVNWMAKLDHEFIPNYKVLQAAFEKNGIERFIDVDKLIRGKYQDNLEFMQFMKCYWEREGSCRPDYDPCYSRQGKALPAWCQCARGASGGAAPEKENVKPKAAAVKPGFAPEKRLGTGDQSAARPAAAVKATGGPKVPRSQANSNVSGYPVARDASAPKSRASQEHLAAANLELQCENKRLEDENQEFQVTLDGLEKERDHYFRKLRLVEMFCTQQIAQEDSTVTSEKVLSDITGILYAEGSDEDEPEEQAA